NLEGNIVIGYPTNIVILIVATLAALGFGAWLILSRTLQQFPQGIARNWRWSAGIVLAAWFIARLALAGFPPGGEVQGAPYLIAFLVTGIVVGLLPLVRSPTFRQIVHAIPETWLVGVHAIRVMGVLFVALVDMKLLPAEFGLSAGYGDVAVG